MLQILLGILSIVTSFNCQDIGIRNLINKPILSIQVTKCRLETGNINVIHPINLTNLEYTIDTLTNLIYKREHNNNFLQSITKHKVRELYTNFHQIKPSRATTRSKRWDAIGTTWKWIAGTPDADDLRILNLTMNQLIHQNNEQYRINEQIDERLQKLTNTVIQLAEDRHSNKAILSELDTVIILMNIDTVNKILLDIQDTILFTKTATVNSKILSLKEVKTILSMLQDQGVLIDIPDMALELVTPKVTANENTILYILKVPQLEKKELFVNQIIPLNINNAVITSLPKHIIKYGKKLFTTTTPRAYVQRSTFINEINDSCIYPMIMGTDSHCNTSEETSTQTTLISDNTLLINNAKGNVLSNTCGPNNKTLTGNFIITFTNCTIKFLDQEYQYSETTSVLQLTQDTLFNLPIALQPQNKYDLGAIHNTSINNRAKLDHVYLKQLSHGAWTWSLFGGLSISTVCICITIFFTLLQLNKLSQKIFTRKTNTPRRKEDQMQQQRVEDDTFSPPGGVTCMQPCYVARSSHQHIGNRHPMQQAV